MTFDQPIFLVLLGLLPILWWRMRKMPGASSACLALKCAVFAVLAIALADPWASMRMQKLAVTVLLDTSASMPRESLLHGEAMLRDLVRKNSGASLRLITFAGRPNLRPVPQQADKVSIPEGVDPKEGMSTDIEGAMQLALSTFPVQGARRILLISDGNENRGHALTAALRAREQGIAVFTVPAGGTAPLPVKVQSIASPQDVFSGERFTLSLQLDSAGAIPARVWITSQGREIGSAKADLHAGNNAVDVEARIAESGVNLMEVHISSGGAEQVLFSQAVTVRRPRVLYVSASNESSPPLLKTLKLAQVDVETAAAFPVTPGAGDWDAVLLDNYPDHILSPEEDAALEKYVYAGGGLIFIAGNRNAKLAQEPKTPLEKMLPVRAAPPPEKPTAVVLVLDKSGSMSGPKIEMAREAARASIRTLRPIDKIGVISFDETFNWVIPMGPAGNLEDKSNLIGQITANGGTKIYQAVESAFEKIVIEQATHKHIILLTDGVSTPGTQEDFPRLEREALAKQVTISTIGVGDYINRELLEELARKTKGKVHFVENPETIPQIINAEVRSKDDLAIQERPVRAVRVRPVEFIDGIDFARSPRLLGFVKAEAKEGSETILRVDVDKPLLVRWRYGLGRVIAFMSDAKSRWAAPWVRWTSFGTLWPQMVRDASHRDRTVRAGVRRGTGEGDAVVYYDVLGDADNPTAALRASGPPHILVTAPGEASRTVPLEETSPGHYEAHIPAGQGGLYRIVSGSSELILPEAGFYREAEEMKPQAVNTALLSEISRVTGGRIHPSMDQLLNDRGTLVRERKALWPYWLILALVLNLLEVALRKGFFERPVSWMRERSPLPWRRQPA
ncbi:MAG TPA: VWA domain-containing protein [Candidatus Dormibacteraeota bacterium]|nr:VWA domain-containing protein [Candidatus Dormibacteraeota bacterium]